MSKEQMMQEFVSSAITPLLERVVVKKLIQSFDVIAEQQKADLAAAKARIAELEKALEPLADIVTAFDEKYYDHHQQLVLMEAGDARRAAALLKEHSQ